MCSSCCLSRVIFADCFLADFKWACRVPSELTAHSEIIRWRSRCWQSGHSGAGDDGSTRYSNWCPHPRHSYSKMGIVYSFPARPENGWLVLNRPFPRAEQNYNDSNSKSIAFNVNAEEKSLFSAYALCPTSTARQSGSKRFCSRMIPSPLTQV